MPATTAPTQQRPALRVIYHTDPGHGWIEVPRAEVVRLGIASKISEFSYMDRHNGPSVYLEEDCDAALFIQACRADRLDVLPIDRHSDKDSFIRRLPRFMFTA